MTSVAPPGSTPERSLRCWLMVEGSAMGPYHESCDARKDGQQDVKGHTRRDGDQTVLGYIAMHIPEDVLPARGRHVRWRRGGASSRVSVAGITVLAFRYNLASVPSLGRNTHRRYSG